MRLENIPVPMLKRAIEIYFENAYPEKKRCLGTLDWNVSSIKEIIKQFADESHYKQNELHRRYTLRLGNCSYRHTKFVIEEYLIKGEFFFNVDTHDQMEIRPCFPDYESWQKLKTHNHKIKLAIEKRWHQEGIPTIKIIKEMIEGNSNSKIPTGPIILIVDDDQDLADATASFLINKGFRAQKAYNAKDAFEIVLGQLPNLILLDYMMPGLNGLELCAKLKQMESTKNIPVILATLTALPDSKLKSVDAFLKKPLQATSLLASIRKLLAKTKHKLPQHNLNHPQPNIVHINLS